MLVPSDPAIEDRYRTWREAIRRQDVDGVLSLRAGGSGQGQRQRVFLILGRGTDERWRFARGMSQPGPRT